MPHLGPLSWLWFFLFMAAFYIFLSCVKHIPGYIAGEKIKKRSTISVLKW